MVYLLLEPRKTGVLLEQLLIAIEYECLESY